MPRQYKYRWNVYILYMRPKTNKIAQCPLCDFSSKRLPAFEKHLNDEHSLGSQTLWDQCYGGPIFCRCGCGEPARWLGWHKGYAKLLRGHNGNIYKLYDEATARKIAEKRANKLRGQPGWAAGLTKETDERIAKRAKKLSQTRKKAIAEGHIKIWSKGKTKETDSRVAAMAAKQREDYKLGTRTAFWTGKTKEADPRVAAMAAKVAQTHAEIALRKRLDDQKRRSPEVLLSLIECVGSTIKLVSDVSDYRGGKYDITIRCDLCDTTTTDRAIKFFGGRCPTCIPASPSKPEQELYDFVLSLSSDAIHNSRRIISPQELDIYVPSKNFAIEFNGLYWHSEAQKEKRYHIKKTQACAFKGIRLLHVFEDEWRDKPDIVKSIIRAKLDVNMRRLDARKCEIRELPLKLRKPFFADNHIDGDTRAATICFGLFFNDELVYALSLRKPFHKLYEGFYEVARSCGAQNTYVRGGLSRLSKFALQWARSSGATGLMTYVDRRLGNDNAYATAGWQFASKTKAPRFWWTDCIYRYDRFKFRADKVRKLSEAEVADAAGVIKIHGCKNSVYTLQ